MRLTMLRLALACALASSASADVLELRSGELVQGKFMGASQTSIRFEVASAMRVVPVGDVLAMTFDARTATPAPAVAPPAEKATAPKPAAAQAPPVAPAATPAAITVPAGTPLPIRLRESLDSNRHGNGHRFTALLEGDLVASGQVVIPKGAAVYGQVVATKKSGRLRGRSEFSIELTGVSIGGAIVPIKSNNCRAVTENTAKRTVSAVARGAAIGGLANGSKGARDGAKIGAGAAILTRGNSLHIPNGTLLEFTLAAPLTR